MTHGGRRHNILLVDDEEIFLSSLFDGLRRRFPELTFRTAHDGEAALTTLHEHPVDLVITDLKMPKMDGFQLIAAMHSQYPAIPLLIMTAHSTELSEGRAMTSGALHCIDKPVDLAELSRRIDELFSTGSIASLRGVSLAAFLQLLGLEKKSGIVDVQSEGVRARLYLSGGQIIHADNGNLTGLPAALRTVALEGVEIHFRPGAVPKTPTIDLPLTQILLDAARQNDESVRDATEDFDELAFSESFNQAFDEQLGKLENQADAESSPEPKPEAAAAGPAPVPPDDEPPTATGPEPGRWETTPPFSSEPLPSGKLESNIQITATLREITSKPTSIAPPMRRPGATRPIISSILTASATLPGSAPPARTRPSTALPIPHPAGSPGSLSASARAAVLPTSRPSLPRPPGMGPRSPTTTLAPYSAEANVFDSVASCLRKIGEISGVLGAAFIDLHSGETLGSVTLAGGFETVAAARANLALVRAKIALLAALGLPYSVEDIVITTHRQHHVLSMNERRPREVVFVALARDQAKLALARFLIDEAIHGASATAS
jgi:CheY-like chemotaxis protein